MRRAVSKGGCGVSVCMTRALSANHINRKANVRKLFHQLDGWIKRRLWSFIAKRWRNTAYRKYPTRRLVTELGLNCRRLS
jgi:hypothetical protein